MKRIIISLLLVFIISFLLIPDLIPKNDSSRKDNLIAIFTNLHSELNDGEGCSKYTNEDGSLAWGESYLLRAYLNMYEATGKVKWVRQFIVEAKEVIETSDKSRGIKDYKGRSLLGWSATKYSHNNEKVVIPMNSAMIVWPLLRFSMMAKKGKIQGAIEEAKYFTQVAEKAVEVFDSAWRFSDETREGTYELTDDVMGGGWSYTREMKDKNPNWIRFNAFNSDAAIGRVLIELWKLTNKKKYFFRAKALAKHLKHGLVEEGDKYIWKHYPKEGQRFNDNWEDLAHGAIDVGFAFKAYEAGIVFTKSDMLKFSETLKGCWQRGEFSRFVNGTGKDHWRKDRKCGYQFMRNQGMTTGRWLSLSEVDCEVYDLISNYYNILLEKRNKPDPQIMLGISNLLKYHNDCN